MRKSWVRRTGPLSNCSTGTCLTSARRHAMTSHIPTWRRSFVSSNVSMVGWGRIVRCSDNWTRRKRHVWQSRHVSSHHWWSSCCPCPTSRGRGRLSVRRRITSRTRTWVPVSRVLRLWGRSISRRKWPGTETIHGTCVRCSHLPDRWCVTSRGLTRSGSTHSGLLLVREVRSITACWITSTSAIGTKSWVTVRWHVRHVSASRQFRQSSWRHGTDHRFVGHNSWRTFPYCRLIVTAPGNWSTEGGRFLHKMLTTLLRRRGSRWLWHIKRWPLQYKLYIIGVLSPLCQHLKDNKWLLGQSWVSVKWVMHSEDKWFTSWFSPEVNKLWQWSAKFEEILGQVTIRSEFWLSWSRSQMARCYRGFTKLSSLIHTPYTISVSPRVGQRIFRFFFWRLP